MIDFTAINKTLREVIITRTGIDAKRVIRAKSTGAKPKGVFASLDTLRIRPSAGYVTNKFYDATTEEMVYQTHTDVIMRLAVRNGNPDNETDQANVYNLCSHLHKAFVEDAVLSYIQEFASASVRSVEAIRPLSDFLPTGYGEVCQFDITLTVVDETRESQTTIEQIVVDGEVLTQAGDDVSE